NDPPRPLTDTPPSSPDTPTSAPYRSVTMHATANHSSAPSQHAALPIYVSHVDAPSHGSTSIISSGPDQGKVLYTPDANYNGPDRSAYHNTDNPTTNAAPDPKSDTSTVTVTVSELNDAPTANPDTATVAE